MRLRLSRALFSICLLFLAPVIRVHAQSPLPLIESEKSALCQLWEAEYRFARDNGMGADIDTLITDDRRYLATNWNEGLTNYRVDSMLLGVGGRFVLWLVSNPEPHVGIVLHDNGYYHGSDTGFLPCFGDTGDRIENETRVIDDLYALREGVWRFRVATGTFPARLGRMPAETAGYVEWEPEVPRWGYRYSYSASPNAFSVLAWPISETNPTKVSAPLPLSRTFFLDQTGIIREAYDRGGAGPDSPPAHASRPRYIVSLSSIIRNEDAALGRMCELSNANDLYFQDFGEYAISTTELTVVNPPYITWDPTRTHDGYNFVMGGRRSDYTLNANASMYNFTGDRGFYVDASSLVHAEFYADATKGDSVIGHVCEIDESFRPLPAGTTGAAVGDLDGDYRIEMSELMLLIQYFNSGGYHCDASASDGFAPGPGNHACASLSSDYDPQDWQISLNELLRGIQLYTSGLYFPCPTGEDGYCLP